MAQFFKTRYKRATFFLTVEGCRHGYEFVLNLVCLVYCRFFLCTNLYASEFVQVSCMLFLGLYANILLTDFYPTIGTKEVVLIVWIFSLIVEEIRQVCSFLLFCSNLFVMLLC